MNREVGRFITQSGAQEISRAPSDGHECMLVPIGEHCFVIFAESFRKNQDPKSLVRVESTKSQQASKLNRSMKRSKAAMQSLSCPEGMYFSPYICDPKNSDMGAVA